MSLRWSCCTRVSLGLRWFWALICRRRGSSASTTLVLDLGGPNHFEFRRPITAALEHPRPYLAVVELSPDFVYSLLTAKSPGALEQLFPPFLGQYLDHPDLLTGHPVWTPRTRAVRALRAGVSARRVWLGEFHKQAASLACPGDNQFYIVLQTRGRDQPCFTASFPVYVSLVIGEDGNFVRESISHSFATLAEIEIFCRGAQIQWPQEIHALL